MAEIRGRISPGNDERVGDVQSDIETAARGSRGTSCWVTQA